MQTFGSSRHTPTNMFRFSCFRLIICQQKAPNSFIHYKHLYSASSSGTTQSSPFTTPLLSPLSLPQLLSYLPFLCHNSSLISPFLCRKVICFFHLKTLNWQTRCRKLIVLMQLLRYVRKYYVILHLHAPEILFGRIWDGSV